MARVLRSRPGGQAGNRPAETLVLAIGVQGDAAFLSEDSGQMPGRSADLPSDAGQPEPAVGMRAQPDTRSIYQLSPADSGHGPTARRSGPRPATQPLRHGSQQCESALLHRQLIRTLGCNVREQSMSSPPEARRGDQRYRPLGDQCRVRTVFDQRRTENIRPDAKPVRPIAPLVD